MKSIYRILLAFCMAAWGHRNQRDKAGKRYIWHLVRVAWIAYGLQPSTNVVLVGLLHDYLEDLGDKHGRKILRKFGYQVWGGVVDLTRIEGKEYPDYIRHVLIFGSEEAQTVKLADLLDNTQPRRMPMPARDDAKAWKKGCEYTDAIEALAAQRVARSWGGGLR